MSKTAAAQNKYPGRWLLWRRRLGRLFIVFFFLHFVYILYGIWFMPPITLTQLGSLFGGHGLKRTSISFEEMGYNIKLAVISSEDQLFPEHNGFDLKAIQQAIEYNEKHPKKRRGASTISQQVAKNVFLWQGGGFFRKGLEVYFTFMIELFWSKKKILATYLNVAEMGEGIFGVQAAAKKYFKKNAAQLSRAEAAMIAACLPNPKLYGVKPISRYVANRYDDIMRQMNNLTGDPEIEKLIKNAPEK
jgi:monofunctional biosynthetic peptidoglycan transglycosylase